MKPRSLMFTLYGDYIQFYGGEVWVGSLIKMMKEFGISESSVRGAILRMVQQDLLKVRKIGNRSYYSMTEKGKRRIDDGHQRVYSIRSQKWDGYWRIMTYSIPEEKRALRNQIRKELNWTGFGMISNSTWVSPNSLEKQVMEMIQTYQLENNTVLFSASSIVSHDNEDIIKKGWDLETLSEEYLQFISQYEKIHEVLKEKAWDETLTDKECFLERTTLVHNYRKFLFKDPGFPVDLLPDNWNGTKARELFWNIHQLISVRAVRYFDSLFEQAPDQDHKLNRETAINPFSEIYISN
jgi:phenylacetic acid degradation operon negative regulatory protein